MSFKSFSEFLNSLNQNVNATHKSASREVLKDLDIRTPDVRFSCIIEGHGVVATVDTWLFYEHSKCWQKTTYYAAYFLTNESEWVLSYNMKHLGNYSSYQGAYSRAKKEAKSHLAKLRREEPIKNRMKKAGISNFKIDNNHVCIDQNELTNLVLFKKSC